MVVTMALAYIISATTPGADYNCILLRPSDSFPSPVLFYTHSLSHTQPAGQLATVTFFSNLTSPALVAILSFFYIV